METYETIGVERRGAVAIITMNRPEALNAFTNNMLDELLAAVEGLAKEEPIRVLVFAGAGRAFSAGQDLKEYLANKMQPMIGRHLRRRYHPLIEAVARCPKPTIAMVGGVAAGAGMSLALACDFRIVSERAKFVQAFVGIGLVPDSGSSYFLPRLIGYPRALEMAMTGESIDAATAKAWGLANQLVLPEDLESAALAWAEKLSKGAPMALSMVKRELRRGLTSRLQDALDFEADLQTVASRTEDHQIGIQAFLEKHPPDFVGR